MAACSVIEAGFAFGQLQDHGMVTDVLDQIVHQTNTRTREAIKAILAGEAAARSRPSTGAVDGRGRGRGRIAISRRKSARILAMDQL